MGVTLYLCRTSTSIPALTLSFPPGSVQGDGYCQHGRGLFYLWNHLSPNISAPPTRGILVLFITQCHLMRPNKYASSAKASALWNDILPLDSVPGNL